MSMITLGVSDLPRAIAFYESVLGWKKSESPPEIAFFDLNGIVFSLYPREALAKDVGGGSGEGPSGHCDVALAYNVRSKEAVDEAFAHLKTMGTSIVKEPQEQFWGGYSGYFSDPDGHKWEVAYNPFWTIRDDGSVSTVQE